MTSQLYLITLAILCCFFGFAETHKVEKAGCSVTIDDSKYFRFYPLFKKHKEYSLPVKHRINGYDSLLFNACEKLSTCPGNYASLHRENIEPSCFNLTTDNEDDIALAFHENSDLVKFNTTIVELTYYLENTTDLPKEGKITNFTLRLICDRNYVEDPLIELQFNENGYPAYTVNFYHTKCCVSVSIEGFWKFVNEYYFVFGVFLIGFGLVLAFYGAGVVKAVIIFSVAVMTMSFVGSFLYSYVIPDPPEEWMNWVALGCLTAAGIGLGFFFLNIIKAGIFLVGALGGVIPGLMLYQAVVYLIKPDSQAPLYITVFLTSATGGFLTLWASSHVMVVITAIVGAYFVGRGVSFFAGGYPNEFLLYTYFTDQEATMPSTMYAYLGAMLVLAGIGIGVQEKWVKKTGDEKDYRRIP